METRWETLRNSYFALKNLPRWLAGRLESRLPAFYATRGRRLQKNALFRFFGLPRDCFSSMFAWFSVLYMHTPDQPPLRPLC